MKPILLGIALLCSVFAHSQNITGKVQSPNGKLLEDVAVFNKNSGSHTHTDASGTFTLSNNTVNDS